ncbi:MAG TPA: ABC transporter substrate-binding protein [Acidimicrobiia bacterium]|nr:ABC transporter substrate-binding protein [Acidimicrobiia bacterium]
MRRYCLLLALLLSAAACGGGSTATTSTADDAATPVGETTTTEDSGFPVTVQAANGAVEVVERPSAIISLSPTSTEMLFAIGAGDQVIAVDEFSNYPDEAPTTDLSGYEPNVEAIAALNPDLVVVSDDLNDIVAALTAIQVPVIHHPAAGSLEDTYSQIEQLGVATGNLSAAASLVASMQSDIEGMVEAVGKMGEALTYYHELDGTLFSVTSETFIGQVYAMVGLENIADAAGGAESGYPQLSAEYIIDSDPDLIFLADTKCCGETPDTVAARPGWNQLTAVANQTVIPLDDDIASRWGPRIVDLLAEIVEEVLALEGSTP